MDEKQVGIYVIYLRHNGIILSKVEYSDWREIQDEYDDYMTSLGPWQIEDIIDFFEDEYEDESKWGFSRQDLLSFAKSPEQVIKSD